MNFLGKKKDTSEGRVLVLGGTGKTGRRVAARLEEKGRPVRVGSRASVPAFDWDNESGWSACLEGVTAAYITYAPDLAMPGAADAIRAFVKLARRHGVRHLVLLSGRGEAEAHEVTGPRLMTFADIAADISSATGRPVRYVDVPHDAFVASVADSGAPKDVVWMLDYLFSTVLDGRNASLTDGVQRALGRPPKDFADYARDVAATGLWNVVE